MPYFSEIERILQSKFKVGEIFLLGQKTYTVVDSGKPRPSSGECKTDLYISADSVGIKKEFKISIKLSNAEFLENKTNSTRAKEIFGPMWSDVITNASKSIQNKFCNLHDLIKYSSKSNTYTITLGWKFEIFNDTSRTLQVPPNLSNTQKVEVLSGFNLSDDKKNALVNGREITNSGVADYILEINTDDNILDKDLNSIIKTIIPIKNYSLSMPNMNFGFTALNYRSDGDKWDGDRPLAVWMDWKIKNSKLSGKVMFSNPLVTKGNEIGKNLQILLDSLDIKKEYISESELRECIDNLNIFHTIE